MARMKTPRADDNGDDVASGRHRYPTRWKLGRHSSSSSSSHHNHQPQVSEHQLRVPAPCKRRKAVRRQFCLPREILFDILLLIPAEPLHEVMRCECKQWFDIVRDPLFVTAHHHHHQMTSPGFLIQDVQSIHASHRLCYFEAAVDSSRSSNAAAILKLTDVPIPFLHTKLIGSFNGLVLLRKPTDGCTRIHYLINLVTKVKISLPPLPFPSNSTSAFGLTSSGLYKVFCDSGPPLSGKPVKIVVFTVGVDTDWRYIDLPATSSALFMMPLISCFIAGFIYWYTIFIHNGIALDVDTETFHHFSLPFGIHPLEDIPSHYLITATCLGFIKLKEDQDHMWRFWKLTDVKTGEWTEMADQIDVQPVLRTVDKQSGGNSLMKGFLRLIDDELWFYRRIDSQRRVVCYNLVTQRYQFFPFKNAYYQMLIHPHVHTLVSPKNCDPGILL